MAAQKTVVLKDCCEDDDDPSDESVMQFLFDRALYPNKKSKVEDLL